MTYADMQQALVVEGGMGGVGEGQKGAERGQRVVGVGVGRMEWVAMEALKEAQEYVLQQRGGARWLDVCGQVAGGGVGEEGGRVGVNGLGEGEGGGEGGGSRVLIC